MTNQKPQPGWYEEAPGSKNLRWWDGSKYTDDVRVNPAYEGPAPVSSGITAPEGSPDAATSEVKTTEPSTPVVPLSKDTEATPVAPADAPRYTMPQHAAPAAPPAAPPAQAQQPYYAQQSQPYPPRQPHYGAAQNRHSAPQVGVPNVKTISTVSMVAALIAAFAIAPFLAIFAFILTDLVDSSGFSIFIVSLIPLTGFIIQGINGIRAKLGDWSRLPGAESWQGIAVANIAMGAIGTLIALPATIFCLAGIAVL